MPVASLHGKRCFVTGAASGIGRATALAAARQGADLYLTDIDAGGIDVNLVGPISVLECFVPAMIAAGRGGHVVNVSSAAGLFGLPWHAATAPASSACAASPRCCASTCADTTSASAWSAPVACGRPSSTPSTSSGSTPRARGS
ncbi:MAG TPA: SDR family NAD(P)-dependent oxidoreductase [Solirubrobacterales bacterium]|nr:SDR family NAD(P)-dependent oxidoreductase [Solirubrobacterales bacterium]